MGSETLRYHEPLRVTLLRTGITAAAIGALIAMLSGRGMRAWPVATLSVLWPVLGGHFVELFFLNGLRPRLRADRHVQVMARLTVWLIGGFILAAGMFLTSKALYGFRLPRWPVWLIAGPAFIALELVVHLVLQLRGRDSFYNGRG